MSLPISVPADLSTECSYSPKSSALTASLERPNTFLRFTASVPTNTPFHSVTLCPEAIQCA